MAIKQLVASPPITTETVKLLMSDLFPCADAAVDFTDHSSTQHLKQDHSGPRI